MFVLPFIIFSYSVLFILAYIFLIDAIDDILGEVKPLYLRKRIITRILDLINLQKAEIERLAERDKKNVDIIHTAMNDYAELQKQVDELTEKLGKVLLGVKIDEVLIAKGVEQAVKDTAKEILQGFNKWLKQAISDSYDKSVKGSIHYGGKNSAFHEVKELVGKVAKEKGVEVE